MKHFRLLLPRHDVKRVRIRSYSSPYFSRIFLQSDWIRRDTPYLSVFSTNEGKSGKNADQKNSGYGVFLRSTNQFVRDTILWSRKNWYLLKRTCPNQFQLSVAVFQCYGTQTFHFQYKSNDLFLYEIQDYIKMS